MASMQLTTTLINGSTVSTTAIVADQSAGDLVAWVLSTYQIDYAGEKDAAWAIKTWFEGTVLDALNRVHTWKQQQAAAEAALAVPPISVTIV